MLNQSDVSSNNARLVIAARGISDFGTFLNMVALSTYVYFISDNAFNISLFLACRVMGGIFASLISTRFFRHFHDIKFLIIFDILRAFLLSLLLMTATDMQLLLIPLIAFGVGLGGSMFSIGLNSKLPNLIHSDKLITINGWIASIAATGAVFGSLISGLLIASFSYEFVFIVNILAYLIVALLVVFLKIRYQPEEQHKTEGKNKTLKDLKHDLSGTPILIGMLIITLADTLGSASHNVGLPIFSKLLTPMADSQTMGILLATWAFGKFGGTRLVNALIKNKSQKKMEVYFFLGVALMSFSFIFTFQQSSTLFAMFFIVVAGIGDGIAEVSLISRSQLVPDELRLSIFSLLTLMQMTGFAIGMMIVAPFFTWWEPKFVVLLFHGLPLTLMLIVYLWFRGNHQELK